jgi:hypothetical protein
LSRALRLEEQLFDVVIAPYDFAVLCTVASKVLTHKHPEGEADFKRVFDECRRLNDERVRIADGTWIHGVEGLAARHAPRRTLEAKFFYEKPEVLMQLSQTAEQLMREVIEVPRPRKGETKHTATVG